MCRNPPCHSAGNAPAVVAAAGGVVRVPSALAIAVTLHVAVAVAIAAVAAAVAVAAQTRMRGRIEGGELAFR